MSGFTTKNFEMKREIMNFSKKVSKNVNKPISKFIKYIEYRIASSKKC